jgi:hypothetical protein
MSEFHVGQEVMCVDDTASQKGSWERPIKIGAHYFIRWVGDFDHPLSNKEPCVRLEGIIRISAGPLTAGVDIPLVARRFRPIKPDAIEWARQLCRAVSTGSTGNPERRVVKTAP